jgi:hypothetical protein
MYTVEDSLNVDPFAGDFGDGEVTLSDKIVKAAKFHEKKCQICGGDIQKGERHRALVEVWEKNVATTRFCAACCIAMAMAQDDAGKEWERRVGLYRHNEPLILTSDFIAKDESGTLDGYVKETMPELSLIMDIQEELKRARSKFPGKNVTFAAMIEEVGELATALFEEDKSRVREEAIQVCVMAMRVVLDGDHTFDSWREEKGLDQL